MVKSFLRIALLRIALTISSIMLCTNGTFAYEKPKVYLDVYPEMPQKGARVENKFGTNLVPVGGAETLHCGQNETIGISSLKKPEIILNVTKPSKVEIFLSNINSNVSFVLFVAAKNNELSGSCHPELSLFFQGFSPTFSGELPVGEYGVWVGVLGGGSSVSPAGIYLTGGQKAL